jgi:hypothetical protein
VPSIAAVPATVRKEFPVPTDLSTQKDPFTRVRRLKRKLVQVIRQRDLALNKIRRLESLLAKRMAS